MGWGGQDVLACAESRPCICVVWNVPHFQPPWQVFVDYFDPSSPHLSRLHVGEIWTFQLTKAWKFEMWGDPIRAGWCNPDTVPQRNAHLCFLCFIYGCYTITIIVLLCCILLKLSKTSKQNAGKQEDVYWSAAESTHFFQLLSSKYWHESGDEVCRRAQVASRGANLVVLTWTWDFKCLLHYSDQKKLHRNNDLLSVVASFGDICNTNQNHNVSSMNVYCIEATLWNILTSDINVFF